MICDEHKWQPVNFEYMTHPKAWVEKVCLECLSYDKVIVKHIPKDAGLVTDPSVTLESELDQHSKWHRFDIKDENTWPKKGHYWVALRNGEISNDEFRTAQAHRSRPWRAFDHKYVTHWMFMKIPTPPVLRHDI